jgi:hypothetical protein
VFTTWRRSSSCPVILRPLLAAQQALGEKHRDLLVGDEGVVEGRVDGGTHLGAMVDPAHRDAHQLHDARRGAAHGHLPRVELGQLAAHGHDGEEGKAAIGEQTEHVDAVADPARLHQQGRPVTAEPGPGHRRHAFFLGGQGIGDDLRVLQGAADDMGCARRRAHRGLAGCSRFQPLEQHVLPIGRFALAARHCALPSAAGPELRHALSPMKGQVHFLPARARSPLFE